MAKKEATTKVDKPLPGTLNVYPGYSVDLVRGVLVVNANVNYEILLAQVGDVTSTGIADRMADEVRRLVDDKIDDVLASAKSIPVKS